MVSYNEYKLCLNNPRLDMKRKNYKYNVDEGIIRKGAKWICSMNKAFHSRFFICICVLLHMMVFGVCIYKVEGSVHVTEPNSSSSRSLYENKGVTYESNVEVHDNFLNKLYMSPNVENNGIKEDNVFGNTDLGGMESHEKFKEKIRRSSTLSQGNYSNFKDGFGYEYSELADSMTDEEIDKEVDKLMEYTNNNKEKVYSLWWQIMRNERVKYVMIMKNLYNFFLKLKKKYNVDNSFSEKQWNICKKRVKKNRLNYEKSINTTFLNWCNSLLLRKDDYRKLIKANRLKWKELSIKTEKACRHNMLQAFEEKVKAQSTKLDLDYVTEHIRKNKKKKKITKDGDGCYSTGPNGQYNECMKTSDYIDAEDSDALVEDEVTEEENISDESVKKEEEEEEEEKGVDVAEDEDALKDSTASGDSSTSRYTILSADSAEYMESDILSVLDVPDVNGPASARSVYVQAYTPEPKEMLYRPKIRYVTI